MIYLTTDKVDWGRFVFDDGYYLFDAMTVPPSRFEELIRNNRCRTFIDKHEIIGMFGSIHSRNQLAPAPEQVKLEPYDKILLITKDKFIVFSFRKVEIIGKKKKTPEKSGV